MKTHQLHCVYMDGILAREGTGESTAPSRTESPSYRLDG